MPTRFMPPWQSWRQRLHEPDLPIGVVPVNGQYVGDGHLRLDPRTSRLRLRLPTECIPRVLQLAGKSIEVLGQRLQLGVPRVHALKAADKLVARVVTIKHATSEVALLNAAKEQLSARASSVTLKSRRGIWPSAR